MNVIRDLFYSINYYLQNNIKNYIYILKKNKILGIIYVKKFHQIQLVIRINVQTDFTEIPKTNLLIANHVMILAVNAQEVQIVTV
jgi:hypothetical protein